MASSIVSYDSCAAGIKGDYWSDMNLPGSAALHSQVVKIKAEDQHLRHEVIEGLDVKEKAAAVSFSPEIEAAMHFSASRRTCRSPLGMRAKTDQPLAVYGRHDCTV